MKRKKILLGIWQKRRRKRKILSGSVKNYCKKIYRTIMGGTGVNFLVKLMRYFCKKKQNFHRLRLNPLDPLTFLKIFHQFFLIFLYVILGFFIIIFLPSIHHTRNFLCSVFRCKTWVGCTGGRQNKGKRERFAFHVQ